MRIEADREVCASAGTCALTAPAVFTQDDDDGRVVLLDQEPSGVHQVAVREAADLCPSGAITLR